jgi:hypothetical protein
MRSAPWILSLALSAAVGSARAQEAPPKEEARPQERVAPLQDPKQLGLVLPSEGKSEPGDGRRVIAPDEDGKPAACLLHCHVGDTSLVILPSGRLRSFKRTQITETDRPFEPMTAEDLLRQLEARGFKRRQFKSDTSQHYVFLYRSSESFYQITRDILEPLYEGVVNYLDQWKVPHSDPQLPLVVLIFPDRKTFSSYRPMPAEVVAYYNAASNFVVLHEDPELSDAAPEFALKQAAYTIAHEGVHQILHNVGVQQRLAPWPMWVSEGLPELFCPVKIGSSMVAEGTDSMPKRRVRWSKVGLVNDLRMCDLLKMSAASGAVLEKTVGAHALDSDGYAVAWGLTHYLSAKQPKQFQEFLREASTIKPLADLDDSHEPGVADKQLFVKHFGGDFAGLEADVAKHLNSRAMQSIYRDPRVYQTHYVVIHTAKRGREVSVTALITTSPEGARKWKEEEKAAATGPARSHLFRTQACESRTQAETVVSRIGGKR